MKSMIRNVDYGDGVVGQKLAFVCPGCAEMHGNDGLHMVNIDGRGVSWEWDGSLDAPTLSPSLLMTSRNADGETRCHSYLRAGVFEFLGDCTHSMANQHVPMSELPDWFVAE